MPRIPKWLGDTMEVVFNGMIHPVEGSSVEYLSLNLKKIVMAGDLSGTKFTPGNVIEFRVNDHEFRHYTASRFDRQQGVCEMLVYLHGKGEGSRWAESIKAGDRLKMMGPGGKINYRYAHSHHFVFGDETSLGLFACLKEAALENDHPLYCLAELEENYSGWPELVHVPAEVVGKSFATPALPATEKISALGGLFWQEWRDAAFYLTGRARSIQAVRKELLSQGVSMKNIQTEPYWAEGKKGL